MPVESSSTRPDVNAMVFPSGDHRAALADQLSSSSWRGAEWPSVATIQTDGMRRFFTLSIRDDTYATWLPSGDNRGSATKTKLK